MKMFRFSTEELEEYEDDDGKINFGKCGKCNWEISFCYVLADSHEGAIQELIANKRGLCGECISDLLAEGNYYVLPGGYRMNDRVLLHEVAHVLTSKDFISKVSQIPKKDYGDDPEEDVKEFYNE